MVVHPGGLENKRKYNGRRKRNHNRPQNIHHHANLLDLKALGQRLSRIIIALYKFG
jgi:hypothetical protein